jgi:hypothetical protein
MYTTSARNGKSTKGEVPKANRKRAQSFNSATIFSKDLGRANVAAAEEEEEEDVK